MPPAQPQATVPIRTSRQFNLISAGLAFVLWGGWAYFVNAAGARENAGHASPLSSGLTQGTGSFLITLFMVRTVAWLYQHLPTHPLRIALPAMITVLVTGSCLTVAHTLVGTSQIVRTIAPALTVAFLFNVFTTFKLRRQENDLKSDLDVAPGASL